MHRQVRIAASMLATTFASNAQKVDWQVFAEQKLANGLRDARGKTASAKS